jgi:nucleoid-associated protein YgaU
MSGRRRTVAVVLVAALGIALAAAITYGTSQLVRQHIGLAGEPLTAGSRLLAPPPRTHTAPARRPGTGSAPRTAPRTTSSAAPSPTAPVPVAPAPEVQAAQPQPSAPSSPSGASAPAGGEGDHARAGDD